MVFFSDNVSELAVNTELGKVLRTMHPRWKENGVYTDKTGLIADNPSQRVDILFNHPTGIPVAIETEFAPAHTVEEDAKSRLGKIFTLNSHMIEQAIALRLPQDLKSVQQGDLYNLVMAEKYEYCLYSCSDEDVLHEPIRWPDKGWISGDLSELASFIEYTSLSENRIAESVTILEDGIDRAAKLLRFSVQKGYNTLDRIAECLRQDENQQTTRMAMAIVANAVSFHTLIAGHKDIKSFDDLKFQGVYSKTRIFSEWVKIRDNYSYWPIFDIALKILAPIYEHTVTRIMNLLIDVVNRLESLGATSQHDLSGRMFQRLITDRKFLATYYTLPSSATLLAELAVSRLPSDWSDKQSITQLKIADFACGTGALLNASFGAILSRYRRSANGADDANLHASMIEKVLIGTDIMPAASHLTTSILSSAHPTVTFKNTQIITLKYGEMEASTGKDVFIGALELINQENTFPEFRIRQDHLRGEGDIDEKPVDLPHETFDLVIMNPPFTRPVGHEGKKKGILVPSFAAFGTKAHEQRRMSDKLKKIKRENQAGNGLAGLASNFIDLADSKVKPGGVVALVLPSTFASGEAWSAARHLLEKRYHGIIVISISEVSSKKAAFSSDTGMAEILVLATRNSTEVEGKTPVDFVNLRRRPVSLLEAFHFSKTIRENLRQKSDKETVNELYLDSEMKNSIGHCITSKQGFNNEIGLPGVIRVRDSEISRIALQLSQGSLTLPRRSSALNLPVVKLEQLGERGPIHYEINGKPNGIFDVVDLNIEETPTYPVLWAHNVKSGRENTIVVQPDKQGQPRDGMREKADSFWNRHAGRLLINRDFRLNSQSLAACRSTEPVIGGRAWPSFKCHNNSYEVPIVLWLNTSIGLFSHWLTGTRQQPGRSMLSITLIPSLPVLDVRTMSKSQLSDANAIFNDFLTVEFLPANEAWRDEARIALDNAVLLDMLKQSQDVMESLALLRNKWSSEPSVHGGKSTRPQ